MPAKEEMLPFMLLLSIGTYSVDSAYIFGIMKKLLIATICCNTAMVLYAQQDKKFNDTAYLQPVEINAVRADSKAPFTKTNISKKDIEIMNLGQDLPFLLNQTPGTVINSDAGNGIGYTGIRIRGNDATRINVTLNGIPYNDAESQGTFFVDLPDFASSVNSIQIQRGVGTSSNGAGAFGGTLNLTTNEFNPKGFIEFNNSAGSFNTFKHTLKFGSGLLGRHFTIDGRSSIINSNGYIDRAKTRLNAFYISPAYTDEKNSLRLNIFSGKEKTYQAWNGVPGYLLETNRTYNSSGTEKPGAPYADENDNYLQTHYQLFYTRKINTYWKGNIAFFLTRGKGYYEQYKADESLSDYGLPDYNDGTTTITAIDIVRKLWLDNYFYGSIFSLQYKKEKTQVTFGGGWNQYDGGHYGEITWAAVQAAVPANHKWYDVPATKKDLSFYTKWTRQLTNKWQSFIDLQYRNVAIDIHGFRDNPIIELAKKYNFFNPKFGITYTNNSWQLYTSFAMAAKEPNRDDFEAGTTTLPKAERLYDFELGVEKKRAAYGFGATLYYMRYKDQLIVNGKINDVGAYTRVNIPNSYRAGIELQGNTRINAWINIAANISFSENKIKRFTEYLDDYDNGGQQSKFYKKTNIAFSPSVVSGTTVNFIPVKNAGISLLGKYVSRQYLDNTSQRSRSLDPFFVQDIRMNYQVKGKLVKEANFILQLNNIFSKRYEPNGYTFSYIYGGEIVTENFYFPMAGFNWMLAINLKF